MADERDGDAAHIFLRRTRWSWNSRVQRGKDSASRYQSLSRNVRAIRTRDCTLAARVRNGERRCRGGRNGERRRDEWRIESDVVVRAAWKDIIERGTKSNVLWKGEEDTSSKRDFDERSRKIAGAREKKTAGRRRKRRSPRMENV